MTSGSTGRWPGLGKPASSTAPPVPSGRKTIEEFEVQLAAKNWRINRGQAAEPQPLDADETPEPEVGARAEDA